VRRNDGTLVAYMRDNGAPPKRLIVSESHDRGETWIDTRDSGIPNPGSGAEVIRLADGSWLFIGNDTEQGRHRLSVWLSADEGKSWPARRALESAPEKGGASWSYPSVVQSRDGRIHATYSASDAGGERIRHAEFDAAWVAAETALVPAGDRGH
jgi:predicted neuraminidase